MKPLEVADSIRETIVAQVRDNDLVTDYGHPITGFVSAGDVASANLSELTGFKHLMPEELLPGARSVVSFFLTFAPGIVTANSQEEERVAREWAVAYQETNALIGRITAELIQKLGHFGIRAAAESATGNFDETVLKSHWSHKSIAVLAGIGSFGLHQLVITDGGCAGRFGSLVVDAELPMEKPKIKERCQYFATGACMDCMLACPVKAIDEDEPFDRQVCWELLLRNAERFLDLGEDVQVCGKCAVVGPCALESAT
jgi:epoxyqueuosine reductase QueG